MAFLQFESEKKSCKSLKSLDPAAAGATFGDLRGGEALGAKMIWEKGTALF